MESNQIILEKLERLKELLENITLPEYTTDLVNPKKFWAVREKLSKCLTDLADYNGRLDNMIKELKKQVKKEEKEKLYNWKNGIAKVI